MKFYSHVAGYRQATPHSLLGASCCSAMGRGQDNVVVRGIWTPWGVMKLGEEGSWVSDSWPFDFHPLWCVIGIMYCYIGFKMFTSVTAEEQHSQQQKVPEPAGPPPVRKKQADNAGEKEFEKSEADKKSD